MMMRSYYWEILIFPEVEGRRTYQVLEDSTTIHVFTSYL